MSPALVQCTGTVFHVIRATESGVPVSLFEQRSTRLCTGTEDQIATELPLTLFHSHL